jgi:uncharacterized SAM-binding protein YcdF (DUF218 family)
MFFVLSKIVVFLLLPSNLILLVGIAGATLLLTRRWRLGGSLCLLAIGLFLIVGLLPVGATLDSVLENRFPVWDPARGAPDGIIVLGGAIDPVISQVRHQVALSDSAERVTVVARLARDYPKARIVFSGGNAALFPQAPPEANFVLPLWESFGIPRERVTLETRSRNTAENAAFTKALIEPKPGERWLLVTSAQHMPRAMGCFRRVGFPVEAYPVDWHTRPRWRFALSRSIGGGLARADLAAHEWEGLVAYWLTGRTSALFPAP